MEEQCEEFMTVLSNQDKVKELVETIGMFDLTPLLIKHKGMDKGEADEIKALYRNNKERLQQIIKKIVEKVCCIILMYLIPLISFVNIIFYVYRTSTLDT